jgi:hypothetical protein
VLVGRETLRTESRLGTHSLAASFRQIRVPPFSSFEFWDLA